MSCGQLPRFVVFEDDELVELTVTWVDQDLSAFTDQRLLVTRPSPAAALDIVATPVDLANGVFKFVFGPGDLIVGLKQPTNVRVIDGANKPQVLAELLIDVKTRVKP